MHAMPMRRTGGTSSYRARSIWLARSCSHPTFLDLKTKTSKVHISVYWRNYSDAGTHQYRSQPQGPHDEVLVRRVYRVQKLRDIYGKCIIWTGLNDLQFLEQIAALYGIIIDTGSVRITARAQAFGDGLTHRVETGLLTPW